MNIIKRKPLTDLQLCYIVNMVLMSIIAYRTQTSIFTEKECNDIMAIIRKPIKNKLKFKSTASNFLLKNTYIYKLMDFWTVQLQCQSVNLLNLFNSDPLLYKVSKIRLFHLQYRMGLN